MDESLIGSVTEVRCNSCNSVVLKGVSIAAVSGVCPRCGGRFSWPPIGLQIGGKGIEELTRYLSLIQHNDGFGKLMVEFNRGHVVRVGLAESMVTVLKFRE